MPMTCPQPSLTVRFLPQSSNAGLPWGWCWAIAPWGWAIAGRGGEDLPLGGIVLRVGLGMAAIGVVLYVALALFIGLTQGRHIFFPERDWKQTPHDRGYRFETVKIPVPASADLSLGTTPHLHGWWIPVQGRSASPAETVNRAADQTLADWTLAETVAQNAAQPVTTTAACYRSRVNPTPLSPAPQPQPPRSPRSRPIVLFFHGNTGTVADHLHRVEGFHQLGLDVLLLDYRGYGHSSPPFPREDRVYADGRAAVDYLTQQCQIDPGQILVYGHSLGGAIALETVVRSALPFAGLVVEGSFTSILAMAHFTKKFNYLPLSLVLWQRFDNLAKVPQLRVPVLFVHGTADRTVPSRMSESLYAAATNPKTLALIPQVDHDITESQNGEHLIVLQRFLQEKARFTSKTLPCQLQQSQKDSIEPETK